MSGDSSRRMQIGAEPMPGGGVHFRVWAPERHRVEVVLEGGSATDPPETHPLAPEADGYFAATVAGATVGTLYRYRLDDEDRLLPDPASHFQPTGPEGPSRVVDPDTFRWTDGGWPGAELHGVGALLVQ